MKAFIIVARTRSTSSGADEWGNNDQARTWLEGAEMVLPSRVNGVCIAGRLVVHESACFGSRIRSVCGGDGDGRDR